MDGLVFHARLPFSHPNWRAGKAHRELIKAQKHSDRKAKRILCALCVKSLRTLRENNNVVSS